MNWVCRLNHRREEDCGIECLREKVAEWGRVYADRCCDLAAAQARIKELREALKLYKVAGFGNSTSFELQGKAYDAASEALATPDNSSALAHMLKQAKVEVLREAAEWFDNNWCDDPVAYRLRSMADEIERSKI